MVDAEEKEKAEKLQDLAVEKYRNGELSLANAAEFAKVTMWEFVELLKALSPQKNPEPSIPQAPVETESEVKSNSNDFGIDDI